MLSAIFAITALLGTTPAALADDAGPRELSFEVGTFGSQDENWMMFGDTYAVGTWGFRYGHGLTEHISLLVGWQRGVQGAELYADYDSGGDEYDYYSEDPRIHTKFVSNQLLVGPKYEIAVAKWLAPYGTVQVVGWHGRMLMDDNIEEDDNPNQLSFSALAPGAVAALGVDVKPIRMGRTMRLSTHLEMGYGHTLALKFKDDNGQDAENSPVGVGELAFNGFYLHWGIGVHF